MNDERYRQLLAELRSYGSALVAFSGGVDSALVLRAATEALAGRVKAVTVRTPYMMNWELMEAAAIAAEWKVAHEIIELPLIDAIRDNPPDRCYHCKKAVFSELTAKAQREGFAVLADGSNDDDRGEYRPGRKALAELAVRSPLAACRLTKQEVRRISRELGLTTWDKPSYACLLTRLPYGSSWTAEDCRRIEAAETALMKLGFRALRVRSHGDLARIELARADWPNALDEAVFATMSGACKVAGFRYATFDLDGYRTGCFDDGLRDAPAEEVTR